MSDDVWKRDEIESPCIKICVIHPESRLCTGCLRSIDEITAWSRMSPDARRDHLKARRRVGPLLERERRAPGVPGAREEREGYVLGARAPQRRGGREGRRG